MEYFQKTAGFGQREKFQKKMIQNINFVWPNILAYYPFCLSIVIWHFLLMHHFSTVLLAISSMANEKWCGTVSTFAPIQTFGSILFFINKNKWDYYWRCIENETVPACSNEYYRLVRGVGRKGDWSTLEFRNEAKNKWMHFLPSNFNCMYPSVAFRFRFRF